MKIDWPAGIQCAVTLTFDVDGETLWLSRDATNKDKPGVLSQGAYGPKVAVPLILDVLARFRVHATFFVPGWVAESYPGRIHAIHEAGHEVAHHGYLHEWPDSAHPDVEEDVLQRGITILKEVTGERPVGYRSPAWEFSSNTLRLIRQYGFTYSSNLMDDMRPYFHPGEPRLVELPTQWVLDDAPFFLFSVKPPNRPIWPASQVLGAWQEEFRGIYRYGGLFNLTMHPQFIGRPGRLLMLEELLTYIQGFPGVWFATCRQVAEYWRDQDGENTRGK
jgi:peptidoglycan/xylan/chitin deacetylase (PgdA/CDA1 family)